jgi:hypothetical protein
MKLTYVPLLTLQRELQAIPRGQERFDHYINTMSNTERTEIEFPPLGIINPMAKEHITELLDVLLEMDADGIGASAAADITRATADSPGEYKASLVLADAQGGWTNRFTWEHDLRFGPKRQMNRVGGGFEKRFWVAGALWSDDAPSASYIQETLASAAYRVVYVVRHGRARTLRDKLAQEGWVLARAGCTEPALDDDDLEYTREVIDPFLDESEMRPAVECLFGDDAARGQGFTPRGLSPWAGIALALHDARAAATS